MRYLVAFSSPKRSAKTVELAALHAAATGAELFLVRIIADPEKVGVVAQLISTEKPINKAQTQIDETIKRLLQRGIKASGQVRVGEVAKSLVKAAEELKVDLIYVGTQQVPGKTFFLMEKDPIVHYLVDHCPISLCLVRHEASFEVEDESQSE